MRDLPSRLKQWDRSGLDFEFQVNIFKFKDYKIYKKNLSTKCSMYKNYEIQKMFVQNLNNSCYIKFAIFECFYCILSDVIIDYILYF